jgi:hypothetical protein
MTTNLPGPDHAQLADDGSRPAMAWVASLPATWTTTTQRLVLLVLACAASEMVAAPGEYNLMRWCGLRGRTTLYDALKALETPIDGLRPALLHRTTQLRRRTIYRLVDGCAE